MQVKTVQYGRGERGPKSRVTGDWFAATRRCRTSKLYENRAELGDEILAHPLDDEYHKARSPVWEKIVDAVPVRGELGRPGTAPARQLRGLPPRRVQGQVARGARPGALDAFLHRLRHAAAEALLRPFPQGRARRLGPAAARAAAGAPRRQVRRARRERVADRAHAVDEDVSAAGRADPRPRGAHGRPPRSSTRRWATA